MQTEQPLKGDIRIVRNKTATLPDMLPPFLEGKSEKTKKIYRILRNTLSEQKISALMCDFSTLAGVSTAIIDLDANVLASSRWRRLCIDFHRSNEESCARCIESDTELANKLEAGAQFTIYSCKNGLVDCASPIVIEGEHVANLFIGQFLLHTPDKEFFRLQAEQFGFDLNDYMSALEEVPIVQEEKIPSIMSYLRNFAELIASIGLDRFNTTEAERQNRVRLEVLVQERTQELNKTIEVLKEAQKVGHIGHWELDLKLNHLSWSDEIYRIFGLEPQSFGATYEAFLEHVHPDDRDNVNEAYTSSVREKRPYQVVHRVIRADNSDICYVEERCNHAFDEEGKVVRSLGVVRDITEETLAKNALEEINKHLQERIDIEVRNRQKQEQLLIQQSKMASMGEMIGIIVHQLKQPLNSIFLAVQNIQDILEYEEGNKEMIESVSQTIISQSEYINATINDFRDFFKPSKTPIIFKACALAKDVYTLMEGKLKKHEVSVTIHKHDCFEVSGLVNEFKQVILNIYSNACDVFEERNIKNRKIDLFFEKSNGYGIVRICDNGGGIAEELLPDEIFEPYSSTKGEGGMGIGLQICRTIIQKRFNGKLWAHNVGEGAEFVIELPLKEKGDL